MIARNQTAIKAKLRLQSQGRVTFLQTLAPFKWMERKYNSALFLESKGKELQKHVFIVDQEVRSVIKTLKKSPIKFAQGR